MISTSVRVAGSTAGAMSDAELMGAMCAGAEGALDALFDRYARLVYRIAAHVLNDSVEAEDSTQDVFLEVYRKAHLYDPTRGTVKGWLVRYAYRRTVRRKLLLRRRAAYRGEPIEVLDVMHQPTPRLTQDECRWMLRSALARLPERQRTTLELMCFEHLTLRDVSERLGVSIGCARHYYYRGLARLRQWARVTEVGHSRRCRDVSRVGTAGGAKRQGRRPSVRS